ALGRPRESTGLYIKSKSGLRLRDEKTRRLTRKLLAACHWFEKSDVPAVRAWCELEILSVQVYAELRQSGVVNAEGEARRLLHDYRQLRQTQAVLSRELGLTPAARMALKASGTKAAFDLASAMAGEVDEDAEVKGE